MSAWEGSDLVQEGLFSRSKGRRLGAQKGSRCEKIRCRKGRSWEGGERRALLRRFKEKASFINNAEKIVNRRKEREHDPRTGKAVLRVRHYKGQHRIWSGGKPESRHLCPSKNSLACAREEKDRARDAFGKEGGNHPSVDAEKRGEPPYMKG